MSWEQVSNDIKFAAQFKANKLGKTGLLDVVCYVYNPAGALVVNGLAATELAYGIYTYTLLAALVLTAGEYYCVFHTDDATVDDKEIAAAWTVGRAGVEHLDQDISECCDTGVGSVAYTYTVTNSGTGAAIPNVSVTVTSDAAGLVVIANGITDAAGQIVFHLDPGTYYFWKTAPGFVDDDNPDSEVVV